jgi:hypothetical protein
LTSFVNAQVVAPLDIQALSATGRDGDFLIAKAAYSLRSLGTRQATLAATGDTVARANGKFVAQVRRSSDDALKSFTADEVTDGTLLAFVTDSQVGWNVQPTFSNDSGTGSVTSQSSTATTATVSFTGDADLLRETSKPNHVLASSGDQVIFNISISGLDSAGTLRLRTSGTNTTVGSSTVSNGDNQDITLNLTGSAGYLAMSFVASSGGTITFNSIKVLPKTGFVKTWYDQSVTNQAGDTATGNHAVQATAGSQPKIVSSGTLLNELDFDGTDDELAIDFGADLSQANSFFMVHQSDTTTANSNDFFDRSSGSPRTLFDQSGSNYRMFSDSSADTGVAITTDKSLVFALYNGASSLFAKNGTATSALNTGTASVNQNSSLGASNVSFYDGTIQEFIIYNSDQTDNRIAIEANIGEAYSIDLPSGVDPGFDQVDGFVETWYDQSGNGRDSINTTATQQPIIVDAGVFQDGLKFTHTDTTNGKRLFVPRSAAALGEDFALIWVGKVTESDTSFNNLLGGTRGVQGYAAGTAGISIKSSDGTIAFINEESTTSRVSSLSSTTTTLNNDFVAFATHESAEAGPSLDLSVDGNHQNFSVSVYTLTSTKDIGIMNATGATGGYRTQESPTGVCREVLVYDTNQNANRVALETNINNQYDLF